jgi:NAD+ synthase (glutamine-hydrolysing)
MRRIKVGAAILNQTPLDWDGNARNIVLAIEHARALGVTVLCLPELCITGYGCEDAFLSASTHQMALERLVELLPHTRGMIACLGLPVLHRNGLFNTACLVSDGRIVGFVAKHFLAGEGIHYEPRWFKPWPRAVRSRLRVGDADLPFGDLCFDCGGCRIGFEICEDAWVADRPGAWLASLGVDLILNPSASHFAFGKHEVRKRFVLEGSRAFDVSYVYANLVGNEAGRAIYDGGALIASAGRMLTTGPRFTFAEHDITTAVIDLDATRMARARSASPSPACDLDGIVTCDFAFPEIDPEPATDGGPAWQVGPHVKEEELVRAVSLALFDYLRKSRSSGFVVSLSGGADSSSIVCLISFMVRAFLAEQGEHELRRRLARVDWPDGPLDARSTTRTLLTCAYQSTRNSSSITREAARKVATSVGADFLELDVDGLVTGYVEMISNALGRDLTWDHDDLALQNIQARARAPGIWLVANVRNALLLATSNRSEASVGYATMDGDTCGGLAPIAGVDKAFIRRWLRWMESDGPEGFGTFPFLDVVNAQQPTAELRPASSCQTDEGDLMPYDVLDLIERAAIRDKLPPLDAWTQVRTQMPEIDPRALATWVERFYRLFSRNQWKRERYAPSFHLDDENVDPKTWFRFPILSGGYERELAALRARVEQVSG